MRGLILGGGAFKAACQLPVIELLASMYSYDLVFGKSAGALNGSMYAQNKLIPLRELWESINGINSFLTAKWYWPFKGLYSMKPLRGVVEEFVSLNDFYIPFATTVFSLTDKEYYTLHTRDMTQNIQIWDAIEASSSITGLMVTPTIEINNTSHHAVDSWFQNTITLPTAGLFTHLDIVTCSPVDERKHNLGAPLLFKSISAINQQVGAQAKITLYAPREDPGKSFDATPKMIQKRLRIGTHAAMRPISMTSRLHR